MRQTILVVGALAGTTFLINSEFHLV